MIEVLKSEVLNSCSDVFNCLIYNNDKDELTSSLSSLVLLSYILAKRCGVSFSDVDKGIVDKAKLGIIDEHKLETVYKDLSNIKKYIGERKE
jgi:hypothetical protein